MKRVLVLGAQVPFVRGGAELLNESLVNEINKLDGYQAELVQLPYKWYPEEQLFDDMMAWRMLDLSESNGKKIDLVIGTKFPTYAVKHPNKVLWLVHQHRYFYDLEFSKYDGLHTIENSKQIRDKIRTIDTKIINECEATYTIAQNVSDRLKKYNNIEAQALFPPAPLSASIKSGEYGDYIVYLGRVEAIKRVDLLVEALKESKKDVKVIIVGKGDDSIRIQTLIDDLGLQKRCKMLGYVEEEVLIDTLANAKALFYAPFDEDYGYATIEAFLAKKMVVTCKDSGEVANIVENTGSGFVCEPDPKDIAKRFNEIYTYSDAELASRAASGYEFASKISWKNVLDKLVIQNT